jgi:streptogrisin C
MSSLTSLKDRVVKTVLMPLLVVLAAMTTPARAADPAIQTEEEALAQDAAAIAPTLGLPPQAALLRLKAQAATIPVSDALRVQYRERMAGLFVEQRPVMRLVVLLTGTEAPPGFTIDAAGLPVPVEFRTGASATRAQVLGALDQYRAAIAALVPGARGIGHDPRDGSMVVMVPPAPAFDLAQIDAKLTALTGVPVRVQPLRARLENASAIGGGRVEGPVGNRRTVCTTGFVLRRGAQSALTTAAHCADAMVWRGPDGEERRLSLISAWGTAFRDVQIHGAIGPASPTIFSDREKTLTRVITGWRTRPQTRVGDVVCIRGESSGHVCSLVELTDFAPPGELCGGLCSVSWVTVSGPQCRHGDSGAPVFLGGTAYGLLKGGAFLGPVCPFYFYMSTDYLPDGWQVATGVPAVAPPLSVRRPRYPGSETASEGRPLRRRNGR